MSVDEERVQFGMWAMLASPLLMSVDLRTINNQSRQLLQNKRVIAVNQDPLGAQGQRIINVSIITNAEIFCLFKEESNALIYQIVDIILLCIYQILDIILLCIYQILDIILLCIYQILDIILLCIYQILDIILLCIYQILDIILLCIYQILDIILLCIYQILDIILLCIYQILDIILGMSYLSIHELMNMYLRIPVY